MSFLKQVKDEILYLEKNDINEVIAEIHGLMSQNFKINISNNISIVIIKENDIFVKRFTFLVNKYFGEKFDIKIIKNRVNKSHITYLIYFSDAERFLRKINMLVENKFIFNSKDLLVKHSYKAGYIRGELFQCGVISDPNKNYHLEFRKNDIASANKFKSILNSFKLNAKITQRKNYYIVYIKEAEKISDVLKLVGAYNCVFELENLIVLKDMKNNINRKQNCEMANLEKTINASVRQIDDINYIYETLGQDYLSIELKTLADLRVNYSDLSLIEIGKLCSPPISKSSVNYRLNKISKIACNLRGEL